jgi:flagellar biosynthesis/type III secretory pathway protein FliH
MKRVRVTKDYILKRKRKEREKERGREGGGKEGRKEGKQAGKQAGREGGRKERKSQGIMKEVTGQLKSTEKQKGDREK